MTRREKRQSVPWRCRLFGHRWRNPEMPHVPKPTWCAGGAEDELVCTRCGVEWWAP